MSPAEELRAAAKRIRERVAKCSPWPWGIEAGHPFETAILRDATGERLVSSCDDAELQIADAEHIHAWHPGVSLAVAELLDVLGKQEAHSLAEFGYRIVPNEAHALARLVLGKER